MHIMVCVSCRHWPSDALRRETFLWTKHICMECVFLNLGHHTVAVIRRACVDVSYTIHGAVCPCRRELCCRHRWCVFTLSSVHCLNVLHVCFVPHLAVVFKSAWHGDEYRAQCCLGSVSTISVKVLEDFIQRSSVSKHALIDLDVELRGQRYALCRMRLLDTRGCFNECE